MERKDEMVRLYSLGKELADAYLDGLLSDDDFKSVEAVIRRSIKQLWEIGS